MGIVDSTAVSIKQEGEKFLESLLLLSAGRAQKFHKSYKFAGLFFHSATLFAITSVGGAFEKKSAARTSAGVLGRHAFAADRTGVAIARLDIETGQLGVGIQVGPRHVHPQAQQHRQRNRHNKHLNANPLF
jgi:hypothetical protein